MKQCAIELIENHELIVNDESQLFPVAATVGDAVRQGDVYICLLNKVPVGAEQVDITPDKLQLAPGSTRGSRHILDSGRGVTMYVKDDATPLDGPVIFTTEERTVTHPEHGDWVLPPGTYGITYQRMYADELRRVQD